MTGNFEFFDHTADVGIRVVADTLPELVRAAGEGLYAVLGDLIPGPEIREVRLRLAGDDRAILLRDYLAELLLLFDRDRSIVTDVEVTAFDERRLHATARVARLDDARSAYHHEIKAVTYHELEVRRTDGGYEATFIVDI